MCMHMKKFTLIEMLVVIAVIGILSSLLLPSIRQSREKAIGALCISNMRQSYIQMNIFTNQNDSKIMVKENDPVKGWVAPLYDNGYVEDPNESFFCPKDDIGPGPYNNKWIYYQQTYGFNVFGMFKNTVWADRDWLLTDRPGGPGTEMNCTINLLLLPEPSEFILIGDTVSRYHLEQNNSYRNHFSFRDTNWGKIWTVHNPGKKANAVYGDGHVSATTVADWRSNVGNIYFDFQ